MKAHRTPHESLQLSVCCFYLLTMRLYNTEKTKSWHQGARVVFSVFYPHFLAKERGASSLLSSSASDVLSSLREYSRPLCSAGCPSGTTARKNVRTP